MFITVCTVCMLTYYALKITTTCWPMIGHLCDMTIETSLDKVWWVHLLENSENYGQPPGCSKDE